MSDDAQKGEPFELVPLQRNADATLTKRDVNSHIIATTTTTTTTSQSERSRGGVVGGWKGTVYLGSVTSFTVLILNLVMILWASLRASDSGQEVLYSGNCDRVKEIGTGVHFLINMLSTVLLSASNFAMQCLSAPTRRDVDRAHESKKWLDIGVPSVRNLMRIPRSRFVLWLCLVWTSVPLHLFYNSTVYSTIAANGYDVYVSNETFKSVTPDQIPGTYYDELALSSYSSRSAVRLVEMSDQLERLDPVDCISAYATTFQTKYGSLVVIDKTFRNDSSPVQRIDTQYVPTVGGNTDTDPYQWICRGSNASVYYEDSCSPQISEIKAQPEWRVRGYKVDYCLAERTPEKCTLEYSLPLAIAIVCVNLIKAILIALAAWNLRGNPLLTVGDAIASFLGSPSNETAGCLLTRDIVVKRARQPKIRRFNKAIMYCLFRIRDLGIPIPYTLQLSSSFAHLEKEDSESEKLTYNAAANRRWSALSRSRWIACLFNYISSLIACIALLAYGVSTMINANGIWTSGLAAVDVKTMIYSVGWPSSLVANTLIANIPQLVFSVLYFMVNSILTNMTLAGEWNNFSVTRKGLRVSTRPHGHQRRTYFLSLPYRYGLPLVAISALLHWLMSQSIFLVRILGYNAWQQRDYTYDTITVGYSPPAIVSVICVGALVPAAVIWIGHRWFKSGMPIAGSCSLAIAAACRPSGMMASETGEMEYELLEWGAEPYLSGVGEVGHCTFSSRKVYAPEHGVVYR
ncbi:hypothetical protein BJX70DRAFT_333970 [Aspergillus crustosus]